MPAHLAPPLGFALGVLFSLAARPRRGSDDDATWRHHGLVLSLAFATLIFVPVCVYFLSFATDWAFAYWGPADGVPPFFLLTVGLLDLASVPAGYLLSGDRSRPRLDLVFVGAPLLLVFVGLAASLQRLSWVGTMAEYHGGYGGAPLAASSVGVACGTMVPLLLAAAWFVGSQLLRWRNAT